MRILFIGDIVGRSGRQIVADLLPSLREQYSPDFVIANGENAAHGKGLTKKTFAFLMASGIDVMTLGNHAFSKDDIVNFIDDKRLLRPINMEPFGLGHGFGFYQCQDKVIGVASVCGNVFMAESNTNVFKAIEPFFEKPADIRIVDFHGEATSEKIAFTYLYANKLSAVIGTHTHVQTADERIIQGCGFLSDAGMCGPYESVLGRDIDEVLRKLADEEITRYTVAETPAIFCGVLLDFNEGGRCVQIERLQVRPLLES